MQTSNRLFDDFAKVASGALHTLGGLREEIETRVRERIERMAADMNLVTREEFDAVSAMAAKARSEQEELTARLARIETELAELKAQKTNRGGRKKAVAAEGAAGDAEGGEADVEAGAP